jgi:hypothetical protein
MGSPAGHATSSRATCSWALLAPLLVREALSQSNQPAHRVHALHALGRVGATTDLVTFLNLHTLVFDRSEEVSRAASELHRAAHLGHHDAGVRQYLGGQHGLPGGGGMPWPWSSPCSPPNRIAPAVLHLVLGMRLAAEEGAGGAPEKPATKRKGK